MKVMFSGALLGTEKTKGIKRVIYLLFIYLFSQFLLLELSDGETGIQSVRKHVQEGDEVVQGTLSPLFLSSHLYDF